MIEHVESGFVCIFELLSSLPFGVILLVALMCFAIEVYGRGQDQLKGKLGTRSRITSSVSDFFDIMIDIDPTSIFELNTTKVSSNLVLKTNDFWLEDGSIFEDTQMRISETEENDRPLVLMFPWLMCRTKHINKYATLYTEKGYDVLIAKLKPIHLVWPSHARAIANEVLDYVAQSKRPLLVHSFSVSGHVYAEMVSIMKADVGRYQGIMDRIRGQIFDSCTFNRSGSMRVVNMAPIDSHISLLATKLTGLFMRMSRAMDAIIKVNETFVRDPIRAPMLVLYSKDDRISTSGESEAFIKEWRDKLKCDVQYVCFEDSKHVSHLPKYRKQYEGSVNGFLNRLGLKIL